MGWCNTALMSVYFNLRADTSDFREIRESPRRGAADRRSGQPAGAYDVEFTNVTRASPPPPRVDKPNWYDHDGKTCLGIRSAPHAASHRISDAAVALAPDVGLLWRRNVLVRGKLHRTFDLRLLRAGDVRDYKWSRPMLWFYLPLHVLDERYWHVDGGWYGGRYPIHRPTNIEDVYRAWR